MSQATRVVKVSVVIAVEHAAENVQNVLEQVRLNDHPHAEVLLCCTSVPPEISALAANHDSVRILQGQSGDRIPHLWRDGILAAQGKWVATTTAHCIPDDHWMERMLTQLPIDDFAGIGGVIENGSGARAMDWAIFLLRYINYAPPQKDREVSDIAADNAVYRRDALLEYQDLLDTGFWEPSFHARFHSAGQRLRLDPQLRVFHHNRYSAGQFMSQRIEHGQEFGFARAVGVSWPKRLAFTLLAPLAPVVFLSKIIRTVHQKRRYSGQLLRAFPWLLLFIFSWGLGEAKGYFAALPGRSAN